MAPMEKNTATVTEPNPPAVGPDGSADPSITNPLDRLAPGRHLGVELNGALAYGLARLAIERPVMLAAFDIAPADKPICSVIATGSYQVAPLASALAEHFTGKKPSATATTVAAALAATVLRYPLVLR